MWPVSANQHPAFYRRRRSILNASNIVFKAIHTRIMWWQLFTGIRTCKAIILDHKCAVSVLEMTWITNHEHRRTAVMSPSNTSARDRQFDSSGRHRHNDVSFVDISKPFAIQDTCFNFPHVSFPYTSAFHCDEISGYSTLFSESWLEIHVAVFVWSSYLPAVYQMKTIYLEQRE